MLQLRSIVFAGLLALCSVVSASPSDELPLLRELYANYLQANGGSSNLGRINSLQIVGYVRPESGEAIKLQVYRKRPSRVKLVFEHPDYVLERGYDGQAGWLSVQPKGGVLRLTDLEGEELEAMEIGNELEGIFYRLGVREDWVTPVALETIRGTPAVRLDIHPQADCKYDTLWLSLDNYQELQLQRTDSDAGGAGVETTYFSDFKKYYGVWVACFSESDRDGVVFQRMEVTNVRTNVGLLDSIFEKPKNIFGKVAQRDEEGVGVVTSPAPPPGDSSLLAREVDSVFFIGPEWNAFDRVTPSWTMAVEAPL
ncbi:MAG: hypothetical protein ACI81V_000930 [Lentimonas sp.]|jgi:hypothetical protein